MIRFVDVCVSVEYTCSQCGYRAREHYLEKGEPEVDYCDCPTFFSINLDSLEVSIKEATDEQKEQRESQNV